MAKNHAKHGEPYFTVTENIIREIGGGQFSIHATHTQHNKGHDATHVLHLGINCLLL